MRLAAWTVAAFLAAASAPAGADAPPASRSSAPQARLVRVLGGGQQALLLDRNQGAYVLVRVGDQIQGLRVTEIGSYQIVLAHPDGRRHYVLPLVPAQPAPTVAAVRPEPAPPVASGSGALVDPYAGAAAAASASPAPPINPYAGRAPAASASSAPPIDPYAGAPAAPAGDAAPVDPYGQAAPQNPYGDAAAPVDPYGQPIPAVPAPAGSRATGATPASEPRAGGKATSLEPPVVRGAARRDAAAERRTLSRSELDSALADFDALGKEMQLRVVPRRGIKILDLSRGSLAHRLGLRAGDLVVSIAGRQVTSADDAAAAYVALDRADSFAIVVERQGRRHTLRVALTP